MQRHVQTELATRYLEYMRDRTTHYALREMHIPAAVYYDADHAERERELIFRRRPLVAAHSSQLQAPGDFINAELMGSSVLVVRQADGRLKAFANVCRHRGAQVELQDGGCAKRFRCPYHAWTYAIDGTLTSIPFGEGFGNLDTEAYGLIELPVDERHGIVWVTLTPGPALDIAAELGAQMDTEMGSFELNRFTLVREATYDEPMNWKVVADGFIDPYHLQFVHPTTVGPFFNTNVYTLDVMGPDSARVTVSRKSMRDVIDQAPAEIDVLRRIIANYILMPATFLVVEPMHFELWTFCPHPKDPQRSTTTIRFLLRTPPRDDREEQYLQKNWDLLLRTVVDEDWVVGRTVQQRVAQGQLAETIAGRNEAPMQFLHGNIAARLSPDGEGAMAPADAPYPRIYGNRLPDAA